MKSRRILILVVIVLAAAAAGWWRFGLAPQVTAVAATRGTAVEIVYATGGVEPVRWAKVASLVRDRIIDICHCEGKTVKKGDELAQLDDREVTAQVKELKAREDFPQARNGAREPIDHARRRHHAGLSNAPPWICGRSRR